MVKSSAGGNMEIRELEQSERVVALHLAWRVFQEYEAPDYADEGIRTFRDFLDDEYEINQLSMFGAFDNGSLVGMIATRNGGSHVALFFVDGKYHRQGIGRRLYDAVLSTSSAATITVNSSPFAAVAYRRLGFVDSDVEQMRNGIRYIPMKLSRRTQHVE